jgi:hypothetical protein
MQGALPLFLLCCILSGCRTRPTEPAKVDVEGKVVFDGVGIPWVHVTY